MINNNILELIGRTPLVRLSKAQTPKGGAELLAKVEYFNPGGSVKDRIALAMIEDAEAKGILKPGQGTIIEPTSGNTGVGLSLVGAVKGYRVILTMPETMTIERRKLASAYGTEIVLTPGSEGMKGAIRKAEELRDAIEGSVILQQFENASNPAKHYATTGKEIVAEAKAAGIEIAAFVGGVGTGGTISGAGKAIKEAFPNAKVIAVEPETSAVLSGNAPGAHRIQGIGAGFVPGNFNAQVVDEIIPVSNDAAFAAARSLAKSDGILVGISSGAALHAAQTVAAREDYAGKTVVVLLPDTGERYLSTDLF